ncbi:MurR/RpiR family transcriptional regulator [Paratissierella segnis]|jgi:DNA-binding MurR/RpiR family transcriptional regulator|uniref:MurR/RpiR family transcriptional regulator n=1 Tax=Paratissierella segnis TaxID=2763679 RepID=A0A926IKE0_9FIRM|nr:MurR/RpiR family transcriptional regulator [Paratissierella segnis]MBC8588195.1 MurR/RpiR family transcriptional regulator [Paratissierella segnis]
MKKNCLQDLRNVYSSLNKSEQKVAKYVLDHPKEVINLTISELAEVSGVSDTTVFRLCNKLGFSGYQSFKINLAGCAIKPLENLHEEVLPTDDAYIVMQRLALGYNYSFEKTIKSNKIDKLNLVVDKLKQANKVYFFGMGGSFPFAQDAYHKFVRNGITGFVTADLHWQFMYISTSDENDIVFIFSNSGSNKDLLDVIAYSKEQGRCVISITSNAKSPIALNSDISLIAYGREYNLRSEALESRLSTLLLIDTLYMMVAIDSEQSQENTLNNLYKIREGISKRRV